MDEQNEKEAGTFNSVLNAAQKKLGISPEQEAAPTEDAAEAPADDGSGGEKKGKLTQKQIEALLSDDEEKDADGKAKDGDSKEKKDDAPEIPPAANDLTVEGEPNPMLAELEDDDTDEIASILGESISKSTEEEAQAAAPSPEKQKKNIFGMIITVAAVVVALALGFCTAMLMFSDVIKSDNEQFAIRAANAVNSKLPINSELYIYRAYVKKSSSATECMLYYTVCYGANTTVSMCKVSVASDKPNTVNIYYTLDENSAEYLAMKQSEDAEVRVQASFLKNYSDAVYAADKLIQIDAPQWEKTDCTKINRNITSPQQKNAAPAQTTAAASEDIDDIADIED